MPDSFAALPVWAIIAVFAVIGAAAGGSGTYFLRRSYPNAVILRYLPILATVAGAALGTLIALPTIRAERIDVSCAGAEAYAAEANETAIGGEVDEVTRGLGFSVDCAATEIVFDLAVALNMTDIPPADWIAAEGNFNRGLCNTLPWSRFLDEGWTFRNRYAFQDGGTRTFTADCNWEPPEAVAPATP
ncbi:MAG: hypothetical protein ACWA6X_02930 [Bauldia sp.]|jgi:hypothetical protein